MLVVMARFLSLGAQPNPGGSVRSRRDRKGIGVSAVQFFSFRMLNCFVKFRVLTFLLVCANRLIASSYARYTIRLSSSEFFVHSFESGSFEVALLAQLIVHEDIEQVSASIQPRTGTSKFAA